MGTQFAYFVAVVDVATAAVAVSRAVAAAVAVSATVAAAVVSVVAAVVSVVASVSSITKELADDEAGTGVIGVVTFSIIVAFVVPINELEGTPVKGIVAIDGELDATMLSGFTEFTTRLTENGLDPTADVAKDVKLLVTEEGI